jgi:hypothetical protein
MTIAKMLCDWTTVAGSGFTLLRQTAEKYVDALNCKDVTVFLEVAEVTNAPLMYVETSPMRDERLFVSMLGTFLPTVGVAVNVVRYESAANPLARYVRWRVVGTGSGYFSMTFRIWLALNESGKARRAAAMVANPSTTAGDCGEAGGCGCKKGAPSSSRGATSADPYAPRALRDDAGPVAAFDPLLAHAPVDAMMRPQIRTHGEAGLPVSSPWLAMLRGHQMIPGPPSGSDAGAAVPDWMANCAVEQQQSADWYVCQMKWWADVQECNTTCQNLYPCDPDIAKICRILVPVGSWELAFKMCMESEKDGYTQCQTAKGLCASNCILGLPDCYMMYPAANNPAACLPPGSEVLGFVSGSGGDAGAASYTAIAWDDMNDAAASIWAWVFRVGIAEDQILEELTGLRNPGGVPGDDGARYPRVGCGDHDVGNAYDDCESANAGAKTYCHERLQGSTLTPDDIDRACNDVYNQFVTDCINKWADECL